MNEEQKKPYGLTYIKLYVDEIELIETTLPPEAAARLLFAIGNYAKDGTKREVPPEIRFAFADFVRKVDIARKSAEAISERNRENGAKGGRPKKAKNEELPTAQANSFHKPTLAEFKSLVFSEIERNYFERVEPFDVRAFYDDLKRNNWAVKGKPFRNKEDLTEAICAKFGDFHEEVPRDIYWEAWEIAFADVYEIDKSDGKHLADEYDFFDEYDEKEGTWKINGETFTRKQWREALEQYLLIRNHTPQ